MSLQLIADKLARLTWRRRLLGVDERQVWHVIGRLDEMYRQLYREQELRYQALLAEARSGEAPLPGETRELAATVQPVQLVQMPSGSRGSPPR